VPEGKTVDGMLESGETKAMASKPSSSGNGSARAGRLFPDFKKVEMEYYARTRVFPIMHIPWS
jgi:4,5-dihydroxyphthalate decarboxylase